GRNRDRGSLKRFLELVIDGTISPGSVLIIEQVNRLSRLPWLEQAELWRDIPKRGIIIRTFVPPRRFTAPDGNDLSLGCPIAIYMMMAHQSSVEKSQWGKEAWGEKRKRAEERNAPHGQMRPAWIDVATHPHPKDPERLVTTKYFKNEERARVVQM